MLDKSVEETKIVFVTTSANGVAKDKRWLISIMNQLVKMNFKEISLLDFAGLPEGLSVARLEDADVIFFCGGNTYHLMYEIRKAHLQPVLEKLFKTRIFVGNSAGSIVAAPDLSLGNPAQKAYSQERKNEITNESLSYVNFHMRPHFNVEGHPSTVEQVQEMIDKNNVIAPVYLIDDDTAIQVIDGEVEVISEGEWKRLN